MATKEAKSKEDRFREAAAKMRELEETSVVTADTLVHELPLFKCLEFGEPARRDLLEKYVELGRQETSVTLVQIPKAKQFHDSAAEQLSGTLLLANKVGSAKTDKTARKVKNRIMQTNDVVVQCQSVFYACSNVCDKSINVTVLLQRELILSIELAKQFDQLDAARSKQASARDSKTITAHGKEVRSLERKVERNRIQLSDVEKMLHTELQKTRTEYYNNGENWGVLKNIDKDVWTVVLTPVFRRLAFAKLLLAEASTELERLQLEKSRIPHQRDELQAEIAKIANKQYRQLARKFHTDKGGDKAKFDEIKLAQRVITDTSYKDPKSSKGNLLMDYITRRDHNEFMDLMKDDEAKDAKAGVSATLHAKKKESGKYVVDEQAKSRSRAAPRDGPRLMIEGGLPPKSKKPHVKEAPGNQPGQSGRSHLQVSWGPGSHLASKFELFVRKVGADSWPTTYSGDRDYTQLRMRFPGIYEACVRGGNTHGWGEVGMESTFELDNKGRLVTETDEFEQDPAILAKQRAHSAKATNLNMLKRVVNRVTDAMSKVLHQHDRPQAIHDLKTAVLASKQSVFGFTPFPSYASSPLHCRYQTSSEQHATLLGTARDLLVTLRRKELTKEWRNELKTWSERLTSNDTMSLDEIELEVRIRLRSLDSDRLNWFLQFQLTGCKKLTDSYRGDLASMPTQDRHKHRQLARVLVQIKDCDELSDKLKEEFGRRIKDLEAALERSEVLEEEQRKREVEVELRRLQREKVWEADRERRERELAQQIETARRKTEAEERERQDRTQRQNEEEAERLKKIAEESHSIEPEQVSVAPASAEPDTTQAPLVESQPYSAPRVEQPNEGGDPPASEETIPTKEQPTISIKIVSSPARGPDGGRGGGRGRRRGRGGARTRLERPLQDGPALNAGQMPSVPTTMGPPGPVPMMPFLPPMLPPMLPPVLAQMAPQMPQMPPVQQNGGFWNPPAPSGFSHDAQNGTFPGSDDGTTQYGGPGIEGHGVSGGDTFGDQFGANKSGSHTNRNVEPEQDGGGLLDHRLREFLRESQMLQYAETFAANEIDYDTLLMLEANDLSTMGINKLGPQKKLLRAINQLRAAKSNNEIPNVKRVAPGTNPDSPEFSPKMSGTDELTSILGSGWDDERSTKVWGDDTVDGWNGGGSLWTDDNPTSSGQWQNGHSDAGNGWSNGSLEPFGHSKHGWDESGPQHQGGLFGVGSEFGLSADAPEFHGDKYRSSGKEPWNPTQWTS